jgi:hypothetical protein
MKKTLLLSAMILMALVAVNAQKVWNLGGDPILASTSPAFATSSGVGTGPFPVTIDGLDITGISSNANMGGVNASVKSLGSYNFVNRFQNNGAGYTGALNTDLTPTTNMPVQRYLSFRVAGNSTIYVIGVTGSNSSSRTLFVTDGTTYIGKVDFPSGTGTLNDGTVTYTGPAATLYLFSNSSVNLYLISATNYVATAVNQVLADKGISFNGSEITNSKGLTLEVYNVLGKKVANSMTSISTVNFQKGIYIVRASGLNDSLKICI